MFFIEAVLHAGGTFRNIDGQYNGKHYLRYAREDEDDEWDDETAVVMGL